MRGLEARDASPFPLRPMSDGEREIWDEYKSLLSRGEYSARGLDILNYVIRQQPANPIAWSFRRRTLAAVGFDARAEIAHIHRFFPKGSKNYQIWSHKQWVMENRRLFDADVETAVFRDLMADDARNFFAWHFSVWAAGFFDQWQWLDERTREVLSGDCGNGSAWIARLALVRAGAASGAAELAFATDAARSGPTEAVMNYLRGLLPFVGADSVVAALEAVPRSVPALLLRADLGDAAAWEELEQTAPARGALWRLLRDSPQGEAAPAAPHE